MLKRVQFELRIAHIWADDESSSRLFHSFQCFRLPFMGLSNT